MAADQATQEKTSEEQYYMSYEMTVPGATFDQAMAARRQAGTGAADTNFAAQPRPAISGAPVNVPTVPRISTMPTAAPQAAAVPTAGPSTTPLFDTKFFLGEMPEGTYQEFIERSLPKQQKNYFSNQFSNIQREYNKALVGTARKAPGVDPTTTDPGLDTFSNFLKNFDFTEKYFESSPEDRAARGESQAARGPRTQFLYNR